MPPRSPGRRLRRRCPPRSPPNRVPAWRVHARRGSKCAAARPAARAQGETVRITSCEGAVRSRARAGSTLSAVSKTTRHLIQAARTSRCPRTEPSDLKCALGSSAKTRSRTVRLLGLVVLHARSPCSDRWVVFLHARPPWHRLRDWGHGDQRRNAPRLGAFGNRDRRDSRRPRGTAGSRPVRRSMSSSIGDPELGSLLDIRPAHADDRAARRLHR